MVYRLISVPLPHSLPERIIHYFLFSFNQQYFHRIVDIISNRHSIQSATLKRYFPISRTDPIPLESKSGVYKLQWNDCTSIYIRQTGRNLKSLGWLNTETRKKSSFAAHIQNSSRNFDFNNIQLLHNTQKSRKLTAPEDVEIIKAKYNPAINFPNEEILSSPIVDSYHGHT